MYTRYVTHTGTTLQVESEPIKRGGEGSVHRVMDPVQPALVAKIWYSPEKADRAADRLHWMINNSPLAAMPDQVKKAIIWPQHMIFKKGRFAGFTMPLVTHGIKLFPVIQHGFPTRKWGTEWDAYHMPEGLKNRLAVCCNLARAVEYLHQSGNYTLVDMKPENILVKPNGHVALIDLDSIQVIRNGQLLFPATVFTPEYAPPEFHNNMVNPGNSIIPRSHDLFSLAVILYQVLMQVHPFQASHPVNTTLHQNIAQDLWVHGPSRKLLHRIPALHDSFKDLPLAVRKLFIKTFRDGHVHPSERASASEWAKVLLDAYHSTTITQTYKRKKEPPKNNNTPKKKTVSTKKTVTYTQGTNTITQTIQNTYVNIPVNAANYTNAGNLSYEKLARQILKSMGLPKDFLGDL